jgi:AraC family transcriptional regulator
MGLLIVPPGLYAQFTHKGLPSSFSKTLEGIFNRWLPLSPYELDRRPHMEVMDEHYDPYDPQAEEEVWIPVKRRV